jgi:hypothetical protein
MQIDGTHRHWMQGTLVALALATAVYIPYALRSPNGPGGGSPIGIVFGVAAYALMLFAGLLGLRKKVPVWRLGRAQTWMRGHLWLGSLSLALVLFHSGFHARGPLTQALMLLTVLVVAGGLAGAALQHFLPRLMTQRVPLETIYQEIPQIRLRLRAEAEQLVASICGPSAAALVPAEASNRESFRVLYNDRIQPFLESADAADGDLATPERSERTFHAMRKLIPAPLHPSLDQLKDICEEQRQLSRQVTLYRWLHAWLLVHVPLSVALLILVAVHAVMALRY